MSRGNGNIQRQVLDVLREAGDMLDTIAIAGIVFNTDTITAAQHSSTRRALRRLADRGQVQDMGRRWIDGRRRWMGRAEAQDAADGQEAAPKGVSDSGHPAT